MNVIFIHFRIDDREMDRFFLNSFDRFRGKLGDCLIDDPKNPPDKFRLPDMLAGAMYGADFQCDMQYPGSKLCTSHAVYIYMYIYIYPFSTSPNDWFKE